MLTDTGVSKMRFCMKEVVNINPVSKNKLLLGLLCAVALLGMQKLYSQQLNLTRDDVLRSNQRIRKLDQLYTDYFNKYYPEIKSIMERDGISYLAASKIIELPKEELFPIAKVLIYSNWYYRNLQQTGPMDIFSKGQFGIDIIMQIQKTLPEPWPTFTTIDGYVVVEVLQDTIISMREGSIPIAYCKVEDDILNTIEEDSIYVSHYGFWSGYVTGEKRHRILIPIGRGGKMRAPTGERINIYYSRDPEEFLSNVCVVEGDRIVDDHSVLYANFNSLAALKADINKYLYILKQD